MAGRSMTAAAKAQAAASKLHTCHLVEVHLDSGAIYMTDAHRTLSWGGHNYLGAGYLLGLSAVQETAEAVVHTLTGTFSGVDQVWIANVLTEPFLDRRLVLYRGFIDASTDALVVDPVMLFDGRMDSPAISEDPQAGTCTVTVQATNHWVDFERRPGRHTNSAEHQLHFPGDPSFDLMSTLQVPVKWPDIPPWL